jgi:hypothetical protein
MRCAVLRDLGGGGGVFGIPCDLCGQQLLRQHGSPVVLARVRRRNRPWSDRCVLAEAD